MAAECCLVMVIEKLSILDNDYDWIVRVRYLFPEAPVSELKPGREFELMEGGRVVAEGVLL